MLGTFAIVRDYGVINMNKRIKELIAQATEVSEPLSGNLWPDAPDLDKLVKLIVLECIDQCFTDDADRIAQHFDIDISEEE